jgi:cytochrome c biogenesis protein CcdA
MNGMLGGCEGRSRWTQPWVLWDAAAVVTGLAVIWVFHNEKLSSPSRIVLGFLPALLWIGCVVALVRKVRTLDEMGKRIHMQAASIAFVATVILNFVSVGLGASKIYAVKVVDLGSAGILIWALAVVFLTRRYQ